jgi:hypothetical protein
LRRRRGVLAASVEASGFIHGALLVSTRGALKKERGIKVKQETTIKKTSTEKI